jgi:CDGSH-type Zn-finger protein
MKITLLTNGPILVEGVTALVDQEGNSHTLPTSGTAKLCRCGGSARKPFCDAAHRRNGFRCSPEAVREAPESEGSVVDWEDAGSLSALRLATS